MTSGSRKAVDRRLLTAFLIVSASMAAFFLIIGIYVIGFLWLVLSDGDSGEAAWDPVPAVPGEHSALLPEARLPAARAGWQWIGTGSLQFQVPLAWKSTESTCDAPGPARYVLDEDPDCPVSKILDANTDLVVLRSGDGPPADPLPSAAAALLNTAALCPSGKADWDETILVAKDAKGTRSTLHLMADGCLTDGTHRIKLPPAVHSAF